MPLNTITYASLTPTHLQWLWPQRLATRRLALLAADPALGKTALAIDLAARLSRALPMPPNPTPTRRNPGTPTPPAVPTPTPPHSNTPTPSHTLLLSPEDHPTDSLLPRLQAADADLQFIHALTLEGNPKPTDATPPLHEVLADALKSLPPISLIIIDPIHDYLPFAASPAQLRALANLAEQHNLAILLTTRLTQRIPAYASDHLSLRRALASLPYASICRTVHLLLPDSQDTQRRHFLTLKSNLAQLPPTLSFSFPAPPSPAATPTPPNSDSPPQPLTWDPEPLPPDHPLASSARDPVLQNAIQFLKTALAHGPIKATRIADDAAKNSITQGTLVRAKSFLRVQSRIDLVGSGNWYWILPGDTRTLPKNTFANPYQELVRISGGS